MHNSISKTCPKIKFSVLTFSRSMSCSISKFRAMSKNCAKCKYFYIAAFSSIFFILLRSLEFFFLGFRQWRSSADRVLTLNMNIRLPGLVKIFGCLSINCVEFEFFLERENWGQWWVDTNQTVTRDQLLWGRGSWWIHKQCSGLQRLSNCQREAANLAPNAHPLNNLAPYVHPLNRQGSSFGVGWFCFVRYWISLQAFLFALMCFQLSNLTQFDSWIFQQSFWLTLHIQIVQLQTSCLSPSPS